VIVVDAACLFDVVTASGSAARIQDRMDRDLELVAPHVVDVEVLGVIRREAMRAALDRTAAQAAVSRLIAWPGERFAHQPLLERAWQLRDNVRGWDAMYVALAELLDATLITKDQRLAAAVGPTCPIEVY
jgi:predicted nucleic acid-binding protein